MKKLQLTAQAYKKAREARGTQTEVAEQLGVTQVTLSRRETGAVPVTREVMLALLSLEEKAKG